MTTVFEHLVDRFFDVSLHRVWIAEDLRCATFPLWNLSGRLVGYQRYRPDVNKEKNNDPREGRYFTRIKNQRVGVWGLESWSLSNCLFVTEGVFDAARLTNAGFSAIATLSNDLSPQLTNWLWTVRQFRRVVVVCDGDQAGRKLGKYGHEAVFLPDGKDVGNLTKSEFRGLQTTLKALY